MEKQSLIRRTLSSPAGFERLSGILEGEAFENRSAAVRRVSPRSGKKDVSELFSSRLRATVRIYGFRDRRALKLLWYDPLHGANAKAVYPVHQR